MPIGSVMLTIDSDLAHVFLWVDGQQDLQRLRPR